MKYAIQHPARTLIAAAVSALLPLSASAATDVEALKQQVEALQRQLQAIQAQIESQQKETEAVKTEVKDVTKVHSEWKNASSVVHLAGYGSVGYTDNENASGRFSQVQFSPIFHYQYKDLMILESELEFSNTPDGETEAALEYLSLDLVLNDYAILVTGKFLSPLGQFRQNFHPSWINKLASAPPGFGHDGAAPASDTGIQLRGGFPLGNMKANYAVYVANGPELEAVTEGGEVELEGIMAEGPTRDADGKKVWGGRFGLLPFSDLELGLSLASGKIAVTRLDGADPANSQPARDYDVLGADLNWHWGTLDVRSEYIRSRVGADNSASATATGSATWRSWYAQAAYKFAPSKFEGVIRYTDFDSPHASEDQKQWALGLNYLFASNVVAKIGYEFNDGQSGAASDDDSLLLQMAYGF